MTIPKVEDALRRAGVGGPDEPKQQKQEKSTVDFFKGKRPENKEQLEKLLLKRARS